MSNCTCGHARAQHHAREDGGPRICDYTGHSCDCLGYQPRAESTPAPAPYHHSIRTTEEHNAQVATLAAAVDTLITNTEKDAMKRALDPMDKGAAARDFDIAAALRSVRQLLDVCRR